MNITVIITSLQKFVVTSVKECQGVSTGVNRYVNECQ
jgi:hypothetical protein